MNRTQAVKAHKLSPAMVTAIESMSYKPYDAKREGHTGYSTTAEIHPRTRKALHDRGIMHGHYYLTAEGVNILAALAGNVVDAAMMSAPGVEIQDMPNEPDFTAQGASECYFGCGRDVVAVFVDYVGRTEGLCATHRVRVDGETYDVPATPQTDAESLTVDDLTPNGRVTYAYYANNGMDDATALRKAADMCGTVETTTQEESSMDDAHVITVIIPGTHALDMGERSYNRFVAVGESASVPGSLFTYGLATAISAHPGMNGTGKLNVPCEFGDVITVRTSLGDVRYVVEDNRYSATGPRKGDPILTRYESDDVRCYVCETHGDNSMPGKNIDGEWVCGYCVAQERTPANLNSHTLAFYVETENAGIKFTCEGNCGSIANRPRFAEFGCEREDAGFVETDSVEDVALSTVPTGTSHHSVDSQGGEWVRFEHVLTVGDVVKITGTQGVYEVHALIPGLPVVYVLGTTGEPFPVGATKLYAL